MDRQALKVAKTIGMCRNWNKWGHTTLKRHCNP